MYNCIVCQQRVHIYAGPKILNRFWSLTVAQLSLIKLWAANGCYFFCHFTGDSLFYITTFYWNRYKRINEFQIVVKVRVMYSVTCHFTKTALGKHKAVFWICSLKGLQIKNCYCLPFWYFPHSSVLDWKKNTELEKIPWCSPLSTHRRWILV